MRHCFFKKYLNLWVAAGISVTIHIFILIFQVNYFSVAGKNMTHVLNVQLSDLNRDPDKFLKESNPETFSDPSGRGFSDESNDKNSESTGFIKSDSPDGELNSYSLVDQDFVADLYKSPKEVGEPAHVLNIDMWQPPDFVIVSEGFIVLKIYVNENGKADFVEYENNNMSGVFAERIKESFFNASYTPGFFDGHPVKSWLKVEIRQDSFPIIESK